MQKFQGDVSIIKVEKIEKNLSFEPLKNGFIVAEGEVSGHHHRLVAEPDTKVEIARDENGFYLKIANGSVNLTHESHATQTMTSGTYFISNQWEYNEAEERRVFD